MRNLFLLIILSGIFSNCSDTDMDSTTVVTNNIALLKVDYQTNTFEGGTILPFPDYANYNLITDYQAPGDFGGVQIRYDGLNQLIFDGSIHWAGLGERIFPQQMEAASTFAQNSSPVALPLPGLMEKVVYDEFAYYPNTIDYAALWNAIDQLDVVEQYRSSNPNAIVYFFLYTPSVGLGNPADWNWYILVKN